MRCSAPRSLRAMYCLLLVLTNYKLLATAHRCHSFRTHCFWIPGASAACCGEERQRAARTLPDRRCHALRGAQHRRDRVGQATTLRPDPELQPESPNPNPKSLNPSPHPDFNPNPIPSPSPIQVRLPSDAVKRDTLTSLAARGDCTAASCEAVGVANKLAPPNEVLAIQAPAPVPVPEVAAAPTAAAPAASLAADDPAAELAALQAQLAALKAAAGQQ